MLTKVGEIAKNTVFLFFCHFPNNKGDFSVELCVLNIEKMTKNNTKTVLFRGLTNFGQQDVLLISYVPTSDMVLESWKGLSEVSFPQKL